MNDDRRDVEVQPRTDPDPIRNTEVDADRISSVSGVYHRSPLGGAMDDSTEFSTKAMEALEEDLDDLPDDLEEHLFEVAQSVRALDTIHVPPVLSVLVIIAKSAAEIYCSSRLAAWNKYAFFCEQMRDEEDLDFVVAKFSASRPHDSPMCTVATSPACTVLNSLRQRLINFNRGEDHLTQDFTKYVSTRGMRSSKRLVRPGPDFTTAYRFVTSAAANEHVDTLEDDDIPDLASTDTYAYTHGCVPN